MALITHKAPGRVGPSDFSGLGPIPIVKPSDKIIVWAAFIAIFERFNLKLFENL